MDAHQSTDIPPRPAAPPAPSTPGAPRSGSRRRSRLYLGLVLTVLAAALPWGGAVIGYALSSEPIEMDLVLGASMLFQFLCLMAWGAAGLYLLLRRLGRWAAAGGLSGGSVIHRSDLTRELLAHNDMPCGRCGYNLRGLSAQTCPECQEPIRLRVASPDPLRPLAWAARIALLACLIRLLIEIASAGAYAQMYLSYGAIYYNGVSAVSWRYIIWAKYVCGFIGLLILAVSVALWLRAKDNPARGAARFQVLLLSISLPAVLGLFDLLVWLLRLW